MPRHGRGAGAGSPGWPGRSGPPSLATVLVAFAAVWLTSPRSSAPIGAASPTAAGRLADLKGPPRRARRSRPIRRHRVCPSCRSTAPCPIRTRVMVRSDATYRLVDLSTGTLGPASVGTYAGPQTMLPRPSGGWACICTDWTGVERRQPPARGDLRTGRRRRHARGRPSRSGPSVASPTRPLSAVRPAAARRRRGQRLAGRAVCLRRVECPARRERLDGRGRHHRPRQRRGRRFHPARGRPAGRRGQPDRHPGRAQGQPLASGRRGPRVELLVRRQPIRHAAIRARITGSARSRPASSVPCPRRARRPGRRAARPTADRSTRPRTTSCA